MAKKSRRVRKPMTAPPIAARQAAAPKPPVSDERPEVVVQPRTSGVRSGARSTPRLADVREEYKYVVGDLKRIGVLAGLIFTALVVLSFFLR